MRRVVPPAVFVLTFLVAVRAEPPATHGSLKPLVNVLLATNDAGVQHDVLQGMINALQGRRLAAENWSRVKDKLRDSPAPGVREKLLLLSVMFGDSEAAATLRKTTADPKAAESVRRAALQTLVEAKAAGLPPLLRELLADRVMRGPALHPWPRLAIPIRRPSSSSITMSSPTPRKPTPWRPWRHGRLMRRHCSTRWAAAKCQRATFLLSRRISF